MPPPTQWQPVSSEDGQLGRTFSPLLAPAYLLFIEEHSCIYIWPYLSSFTQDLAASTTEDLAPVPLFIWTGLHATSVKLTGVILPAFHHLQWKSVQQDERLVVGKHVRKHSAENTTLGRELLVFWKGSGFSQGGIVIIYFKGCWQLHLSS